MQLLFINVCFVSNFKVIRNSSGCSLLNVFLASTNNVVSLKKKRNKIDISKNIRRQNIKMYLSDQSFRTQYISFQTLLHKIGGKSIISDECFTYIVHS